MRWIFRCVCQLCRFHLRNGLFEASTPWASTTSVRFLNHCRYRCILLYCNDFHLEISCVYGSPVDSSYAWICSFHPSVVNFPGQKEILIIGRYLLHKQLPPSFSSQAWCQLVSVLPNLNNLFTLIFMAHFGRKSSQCLITSTWRLKFEEPIEPQKNLSGQDVWNWLNTC